MSLAQIDTTGTEPVVEAAMKLLGAEWPQLAGSVPTSPAVAVKLQDVADTAEVLAVAVQLPPVGAAWK